MTRSHRLVVVIGLVVLAAPIVFARQQSAAQLFQRGLMLERAEGKVADAVALYERVVTEFPADRVTVPEALLQLSRAYETQRDPRAVGVLTRLVDGFPATPHAAEARKRLAAIQATEPFKAQVLDFDLGAGPAAQALDFSADGRYVAYGERVAQPTGTAGFRVHLRELTARAADRVLVDGIVDGAARALSFSRDSKRLAMYLPAGRATWEIRVLTLDGKTQPLSLPAVTVQGLGWSPDSRWIPYLAPTENPGTAEAKLLDVTTGQAESLGVRLNNRSPEFRFSQDGETLAFWATPSAETNPQEVQILNRRTGERRRVAIQKPAGVNLSLGKITTTGEIAVWQASATREGYLVNLTTGEKRLICSHSPQGGCWDVAWEGTNAVVLDEATRRLALHDLATGLDTPLTWGGGLIEERSSWRSPDGRVNVFLSNRDGAWGIYAALLDRVPNMSPVKLATIGDDPIATQIWWTTAGLVLRTTRQQSRLYKLSMDPATGRNSAAAQPFGESPEFRDVPVASPDGKRVAVFQRSSMRSSINVLDTTGKFERTMFETYRFVRVAPRIAWRSNEELIIDDFRAISNDPVAMVTANLRTGRVQTLPNSTIESREWRYVPGLDELLYNLERQGAPPVLKARSLATGADRTVKVFSTPGESVEDFQVSNDGKQIVLQTANSCMNALCQLRVLTLDGVDVRVIATAPTRGQSWSGIDTISPDGRFLVSGPEIISTDGGARFRWLSDAPSAALTGRGMFTGGATWSVNGTSVYVSLAGNVFEYRRWDGVTSDAIAKIVTSKPR